LKPFPYWSSLQFLNQRLLVENIKFWERQRIESLSLSEISDYSSKCVHLRFGVHKIGGSEAVIDDLAARRCAAVLRIPVRGTLGLALIAKQRGQISSARQVLERLRYGGMYLSDEVMNRALALVGE
jgi:predicted nucleic acid-binding protein